MGSSKPIFPELNPDDPEATEIESLCMNCHSNGVTRLLLTKIPFFMDVIVMSFSCEKCGYQNNELQSGAPVAEKGIRIYLEVESPKDLNRQVVKSDYTSIKIPKLQFETTSQSQKGEVTTVEGIIDRAILGLEQDQTVRRQTHSEDAAKIDDFIEKLKTLKNLKEPFSLILEDVSGNSFIENPYSPQKDKNCKREYFLRTKEQNHLVGVYAHDEVVDSAILKPIQEGEYPLENFEGEVLQFATNCPGCNAPCETNMKMTNIPHFKEVLIMATVCDVCGLRTNEVKSGGGIEPKGLHIEVTVNSKEDFSRDVLKSETCHLGIPELDLEVGPNALGGRFTTVEGLISAVKEQLSDPKHSHMFGDSIEKESKDKFQEFLKKFDEILDGKFKVTIVLDDPAGNSYIQSLSESDEPDEFLKITHYERSFEQNEELGLNDMKTENYQ
ncbi:zinc finger protein ZPR1 [Coccinella septempunctata]|uniref:zinc finger protein ZPR1 n=1 Tax=Coccinella septempunctata TaxID=41139 RepID=UPI001D08F639|nr:zinc finger protein ZPR1 [Coccinella septempunctata]